MQGYPNSFWFDLYMSKQSANLSSGKLFAIQIPEQGCDQGPRFQRIQCDELSNNGVRRRQGLSNVLSDLETA